jgi:hypothetical protein
MGGERSQSSLGLEVYRNSPPAVSANQLSRRAVNCEAEPAKHSWMIAAGTTLSSLLRFFASACYPQVGSCVCQYPRPLVPTMTRPGTEGSNATLRARSMGRPVSY